MIIGKGGKDGNTLTMFDPSKTSLFGITGGGVLGGILLGILLFVGFEAAASIGEESEDPHRSIPRALIGTVAVAAAFFVLMSYAFSIGYGEKAVSEGAWAFSPAPVSEMATIYVGSWFATLLELVVILDAMALALAICVMIGRGFFALGRDGLLPSFFAKTSRHDTPWVGNLMVAVGGIGLTLLVFATDYATQFGFVDDGGIRPVLPERPVRDVHPLGDDRLVRDRARLPRARDRGVQARALERQQVVAVPDRARRRRDADPRLLRRAQPASRTTRSNFNWVAAAWTIGLLVLAADLVPDRRPDAARQGRQRSGARGRAPRRRAARRDARVRVRRRDHAALASSDA